MVVLRAACDQTCWCSCCCHTCPDSFGCMSGDVMVLGLCDVPVQEPGSCVCVAWQLVAELDALSPLNTNTVVPAASPSLLLVLCAWHRCLCLSTWRTANLLLCICHAATQTLSTSLPRGLEATTPLPPCADKRLQQRP
jgi:hypothetical protein